MQTSILTLPRDAWRLARPYFTSDERWPAYLKLAAIVVLNLSMVGMDVVLNFWNRAFYNSLQDKDWNSFTDLLLTWKRTPGGIMPGFTGIAFLYIFVAVYRTYLNQWLQIDWRRWMTTHMVRDWLADRAYYRIALASAGGAGDTNDNPDQRIAEDLRDFVASTLSLALDLLSNVVTLFSFIFILWTLSGPVTVLGITIPGFMVWAALAYAVIGTWLTHLIGRKLVNLSFRQQRVEADFRFALVRLRENMEGVALYGGEAREQQGFGRLFVAVRDNWWAIMQRTKLLNALVAGYSQVSVIFPIVVAAPRYFAGTLDLGGLTQTAGAFGSVQGAMSWFVTSYRDLASYRATIDRLTLFRDAIDAARAGKAGVVQRVSQNADQHLQGLDISLPNGQTLIEIDDLVLQRGQSVALQGRSGSGKSTLFRALAGIWPFAKGSLEHGTGSRLFLPQRPYFPLGSLRAAVSYPEDPKRFTDAEIITALTIAGLEHLNAEMHHVDSWSTRLSGGEQQRLAIARALLIKPDWLFMDEATSSLDAASEAELLGKLRMVLSHTTFVSITHRDAVAATAQRRYRLEGGKLVAAE
ncbi:MAG: ABC transporter ATP-binding protein/permease [Acetobacteraceae bacterium]|nr:ABC transporter ATP-binding protein/permease [Acetobacteraceae bacterium]